MTISTVPFLKELADQRSAEQTEVEAWKIAQLAATLYSGSGRPVGLADNVAGHVQWARVLLAESRRQSAAPGSGDDGE